MWVRLITWAGETRPEAAILLPGGRHVRIARLNAERGTRWPTSVGALVGRGLVGALRDFWLREEGRAEALAEATDAARWGALFAPRGKVWGIGLNYADHAADLRADRPEEPASFMKPWDTAVPPGAGVRLPAESRRVTAEAELALVVGRTMRGVSAEEALQGVAGAVAALDFTAEDILERNPRYLTRAKSFEGFVSFGPALVTLDEWPDLASVRVATVANGQVVRENTVAHMRFSPGELLAFHSRVFTWRPGDLLLTGTPGATRVQAGDVVEAHVGDLPPLRQAVLP
jgi:2-keto-4-pentenoate hydratase/2-oxohepta-3-ene-1,7-dioic acid hydratase in catechol pathway